MSSILLQNIKPCPQLQEYVRKYQIIRFVFEKDVIPPIKFHAPRPEHSITFYVRDEQKFSHLFSDSIIVYPRCIINGIYTIPINRHGGHDFWAIKTVFQPTALSRLKVLRVAELTNQYINAEEVLGNEISLINEQLCLSNDLGDMIKIIENYFINLIKKRYSTSQPIDNACKYILQHNGAVGLDWLASQSCLSLRQFIRKFEEEIGVRPKTFKKIIRFDRAFRMKNNYSDSDWLSIAIACGYYDYQHLAKDFKEFTGLTPPAFYEREMKSPERTFGFRES